MKKVELPNPLLVFMVASVLLVIGTAAKKFGDGEGLLLYVEALGLVAGMTGVLIGLAILIAPDAVRRYIESSLGDSNKPQPQPIHITRQPQQQYLKETLPLEWGPWTGAVVFGVVALIGIAASRSLLASDGLRTLGVVVSLIPALFGVFSSVCFSSKSYDEAAKWLMRAGIMTISAAAIIGLSFYGEHLLSGTKEAMGKLLNL
jgi:hypothetical protein